MPGRSRRDCPEVDSVWIVRRSPVLVIWFSRRRGRGLFGQLLRRLGLALGLLALLVLLSAPPALADRSFTTRFNADVPGNITMAANTLMVCPPSTACTTARGAPPIASGSNTNNNNNFNMTYVNAASGTVPGEGASFDSSSATLSLPSTATVLFAGLYWGADTSASTTAGLVGSPAPNAALRNQVGFRLPGASGYTLITTSPSQVDNSPPPAQTRYNAFADVTAQVKAAGPGIYSVANVQAGTAGIATRAGRWWWPIRIRGSRRAT